MRLKLPWIEPFDTLELPQDFEDLVRRSFAKFTQETNPRVSWKDKMLYISRLPLYFKGRTSGWSEDVEAENAVKEIIHSRMDYKLEDEDNVLERDDIYSFDFMCDCYAAGMRSLNPLQDWEHYSYSTNEETQKVMFRIMQIVIDWEPEEDLDATN